MGPELGNAIKAVKWGTDYLLKATATEGVVYVQVCYTKYIVFHTRYVSFYCKNIRLKRNFY